MAIDEDMLRLLRKLADEGEMADLERMLDMANDETSDAFTAQVSPEVSKDLMARFLVRTYQAQRGLDPSQMTLPNRVKHERSLREMERALKAMGIKEPS